MKLDLNKLNQQLQTKEFTSPYLLYGEERYLVEQYKKALSNAIISPDDQFNLAKYIGKDFNLDSLISFADTMPFFSDYRLIMIEDSGVFKSANDELLEYLKEAPEHAIFVFVETEVDKRSKLFKYVSDKGAVVEFEPQKEPVLKQWIGKLAKQNNLSITTETAQLILDKTTTDMYTISNEVQKLCAYCMGKTAITNDDVNAVCIDSTPPQIFEMTRAMSEKNPKEALDYYYELLENKEPPLRILSLITRQFRTLYKIALCKEQNYSSTMIASQVGLSTYIVDKLARQAANFSSSELKNALNDCGDVEYKIKSGLLQDKIGVELLLVKYSN